jgi:cobalt/nickel transport protein
MSTRALVVTGLLLSLLLAGVASYYASSSPDGLMYVAERTGFSDTATEHAAQDSPLAGYALRGVTGTALSGGLAGVVGVLVVGALAGGLVWALRRRGHED